jgi:hypothetical protein
MTWWVDCAVVSSSFPPFLSVYVLLLDVNMSNSICSIFVCTQKYIIVVSLFFKPLWHWWFQIFRTRVSEPLCWSFWGPESPFPALLCSVLLFFCVCRWGNQSLVIFWWCYHHWGQNLTRGTTYIIYIMHLFFCTSYYSPPFSWSSSRWLIFYSKWVIYGWFSDATPVSLRELYIWTPSNPRESTFIIYPFNLLFQPYICYTVCYSFTLVAGVPFSS